MKYNISCDCKGMYDEEIFETILHNRGIQDYEHFLNPQESDLLPLDSLPNIEKAYELLNHALNYGQKIIIHADVDLDGVSAGAIMTRYLRDYCGANCEAIINSGKIHGLIGQKIENLQCDLLIVVDSLDVDINVYTNVINQNNTKIIVLDHHAIDPEIPYDDYITLVSSQHDYDNKSLSGAGVVWKFCKYIDWRNDEHFADELVDLAACGIVGDMMDMTNMENRYIVSKGLENKNNPAIKKIVGSFDFNSGGISFSIAPLINAANRLDKNKIALQAFLEDDNKKLNKLIKELKDCKTEQKEEVSELMPDVLQQCENQKDRKMITVVIDTEFGISGLIANKLLEQYQRPILVLKDIGDKYAGSMRAIGVDDFRKICNDSGLAKAKGHELASGIEIDKCNMKQFISYIENVFEETPVIKKTINADIKIDIDGISNHLIDLIKKIDRVTGDNFKPVKVYIDGINNYNIGQMSNYTHLVIKPNEWLQLIKWNYNGSFEDMEDASLMNDELRVVGSLDSGFIGRNYSLKVICDSIEVVS